MWVYGGAKFLLNGGELRRECFVQPFFFIDWVEIVFVRSFLANTRFAARQSAESVTRFFQYGVDCISIEGCGRSRTWGSVPNGVSSLRARIPRRGRQWVRPV